MSLFQRQTVPKTLCWLVISFFLGLASILLVVVTLHAGAVEAYFVLRVVFCHLFLLTFYDT